MSRRAAVAKGQAGGGLASGVSNAAAAQNLRHRRRRGSLRSLNLGLLGRATQGCRGGRAPKREDIEAPMAQSQKRSAGHDIVTNPTTSRWRDVGIVFEINRAPLCKGRSS
jgi:hypothetical protein